MRYNVVMENLRQQELRDDIEIQRLVFTRFFQRSLVCIVFSLYPFIFQKSEKSVKKNEQNAYMKPSEERFENTDQAQLNYCFFLLAAVVLIIRIEIWR